MTLKQLELANEIRNTISTLNYMLRCIQENNDLNIDCLYNEYSYIREEIKEILINYFETKIKELENEFNEL